MNTADKNQQVDRIVKYLKIINASANDSQHELLSFCVAIAMDRLLLYLNRDELNPKLERITAELVSNGFDKHKGKSETGEEDGVIKSISDNGQSVSYENGVKRYFLSSTDEELFSGFSRLLAVYRGIKVVHPK
jgi:hypothetical protein